MPIFNDQEIGNRLKHLRLNVIGISKISEFAANVGVDQSQYTKIEAGKLALTDNIWDKLYSKYAYNKGYVFLGISVPKDDKEVELLKSLHKSTESLEADHSSIVRSHELLVKSKTAIIMRLLNSDVPGAASLPLLEKEKVWTESTEEIQGKQENDSGVSPEKQKDILKS